MIIIVIYIYIVYGYIYIYNHCNIYRCLWIYIYIIIVILWFQNCEMKQLKRFPGLPGTLYKYIYKGNVLVVSSDPTLREGNARYIRLLFDILVVPS